MTRSVNFLEELVIFPRVTCGVVIGVVSVGLFWGNQDHHRGICSISLYESSCQRNSSFSVFWWESSDVTLVVPTACVCV